MQLERQWITLGADIRGAYTGRYKGNDTGQSRAGR
jgi:hypothetical protein